MNRTRRVEIEYWDPPGDGDLEMNERYVKAYITSGISPMYLEFEEPDGSGWSIRVGELFRILKDIG